MISTPLISTIYPTVAFVISISDSEVAFTKLPLDYSIIKYGSESISNFNHFKELTSFIKPVLA